MGEFLKAESMPAFWEASEENFDVYFAKATAGMLWVCFHPNQFREHSILYRRVFEELARTFKQFPFAYIDTWTYHEHVAEELGCVDSFPAVVLQLGNLSDPAADIQRFRLSLEFEGLTVEAVASWLWEVLAGNANEDHGTAGPDDEDYEV